jgi:transposase InsO family protein
MTKNEQNRVLAWRLKLMREASVMPRNVAQTCRHFGLSRKTVDEQEFYQLLDKEGITDDIHLFNDKLRQWEGYYNYHRPHGALDGQTPYERLLAKTSASLSPAS